MPKVSDGTEHGAHVLFTDLIKCEYDSGVFFVAGRSRDYVRSGAMTPEYTMKLYAALTEALSQYHAERGGLTVYDGLRLEPDGDNLRFILMSDGKPKVCGLVTKEVGKTAKKMLEQMGGFGAEVMPMRKR